MQVDNFQKFTFIYHFITEFELKRVFCKPSESLERGLLHHILQEGLEYTPNQRNLKFKFSKKATKFDKIFSVDLTLCSKCQINGEDFVNFCGLFKKHEL